MLKRILTSLVGIPLVLGICFFTERIPFVVLVSIAAILAIREAIPLLRIDVRSTVGLAVVWVGLLLWIVLPLACLVWLHDLGREQGLLWNFRNPVLLVFIPLWAGDTAAYVVGKAIGKHLLAPTISPKKTWEGALANLAASTLAAWLVGSWVGLKPTVSVTIGISIGIVGQVGDLFESWLKRRAGLKDSGSLLPGHGGILDRIDSLLFTAVPATLIYLLTTSR